jgi:predicted aconitase with swiveling domain
MALRLQASPQIAGTAEGRVLKLDRPISFWGGVDPETGRILDPRHPQHGVTVAGTVLVLPATIGSSSSSSVMLELIAIGRAPAALLLGTADAILALGVVVAAEMEHEVPPVLLLPTECQQALATGDRVRIDLDGLVTTLPDATP